MQLLQVEMQASVKEAAWIYTAHLSQLHRQDIELSVNTTEPNRKAFSTEWRWLRSLIDRAGWCEAVRWFSAKYSKGTQGLAWCSLTTDKQLLSMVQTEVAPRSISDHFLIHTIGLASQPLTLNKGLLSSYLKKAKSGSLHQRAWAGWKNQALRMSGLD